MSGLNVMGLGIWYESAMRWFGEAEWVTAESLRHVKQRLEPQTGLPFASRVPDHLVAVAQMASGVQLTFHMSSVAAFGAGQGVTIYGTEGTLVFAGGVLKGRRRGEDSFSEVDFGDTPKGGWRVEEDFIDSIRTGAPVRLTSFETGVRYMEFTEAIAESTATGTRVPLPR